MAEFGTLKVGDVCKVVGNCNLHDFKIGEEIRLYSVFDDVIQFERGVGFTAKRLSGASCCRDVVREIDLEKVENMDKMKEFTKSDLKVGYVLKCVDHEKNDKEFLQKVENGRTGICLSGEYTWFPIDCLDDNMCYKKYCTDLEVIEIYGFATNDAAWKLDTRERYCLYKKPKKSPLLIELESLEQQQREIADKIAELSKKCN